MNITKIFTQQGKEVSVAKAIQQVKRLGQRIDKQIGESRLYKLSNTQSMLPNSPKEQVQSIEDMISQLGTLKSAILKSNVNTPIKVGGVDISVAEAIILRDTIQQYLTNLKSKIQKQFNRMENEIEASVIKAKENAGDRNGEELEQFIKLMSVHNTTQDNFNLKDALEQMKVYEEIFDEIEDDLNTSNISTMIQY